MKNTSAEYQKAVIAIRQVYHLRNLAELKALAHIATSLADDIVTQQANAPDPQ